MKKKDLFGSLKFGFRKLRLHKRGGWAEVGPHIQKTSVPVRRRGTRLAVHELNCLIVCQLWLLSSTSFPRNHGEPAGVQRLIHFHRII